MAKIAKMIRCHGDSMMSDSDDGTIMVHLSRCNMTSHNESMTSPANYDSEGALRFIVTVVTVYGVAVVGVFALGLLKRKKPAENDDKEAQLFMKDYENVRHSFEQKSRVGAISSLLHHIHIPEEDPTHMQKEGLLKNLAFLALPLAKIAEQDETQEDIEATEIDAKEIEVIEETSINTQSTESTESGGCLFSSCVMCESPLDLHDNSGPLCDNCVNKYRNTVLAPFDVCSLNDEFDGIAYGIPSSTSECFPQRPEEIKTLEDEVFLSESGDEYYDVDWEVKPLY